MGMTAGVFSEKIEKHYMKQFVFERIDNFLTKFGHESNVFFGNGHFLIRNWQESSFFSWKTAKRHPIDFWFFCPMMQCSFDRIDTSPIQDLMYFSASISGKNQYFHKSPIVSLDNGIFFNFKKLSYTIMLWLCPFLVVRVIFLKFTLYWWAFFRVPVLCIFETLVL